MEEKKCPQCGAKMKSDAKFCIHCGYINYDAPGNEDFRNLVVEKKVHKQVEREKRRKEREARKQRGQGTFIEDSALNQQVVKRKLKIRERLYNLIQRFWKALLTGLIIIGLIIIYSYIVSKQALYVEDARDIVKSIRSKYESNNYKKCKDSSKYFFNFSIEGELDTFYGIDIKSKYNGASYTGYVEVDKVNNGYEYYISISDGAFGIKRINIDDLRNKNVVPYSKVDYTGVGRSCR